MTTSMRPGQAESLVNFRNTSKKRSKKHKQSLGATRVVSVTSGKGGVGKTFTTLNLAVSLSATGRRVVVFDADLSLANIDVMAGIRPTLTLQHVIEGTHELDQIIVDGPGGISIIPATSGLESMAQLSALQRLSLFESIERSSLKFDYLLIDTQAGIGQDVIFFTTAAEEILCVITPDLTSLTDAYALIKVLSSRYNERSISVVVNNVPGPASEAEGRAQKTFKRLSEAVERFLQVKLSYIGCIPTDALAFEALQQQRPLVEIFPSSAGARAITRMAENFDQLFSERKLKGGMQFFFERLLEA